MILLVFGFEQRSVMRLANRIVSWCLTRTE